MIQQKGRILWNRKVNKDSFHMGIESETALTRALPGQFVMIRISENNDVLLRRPFSIHGVIGSEKDANGIEILYKVVGKGTRRLSEMGKGQYIDVLGPLGNGFSLSEESKKIFLVAGGIGVAPIRFLAEFIMSKGYEDVSMKAFLGGGSEDDLLCLQDFHRLGIPVCLTTDDGSRGDQCFITDPLAEGVAEELPDMIYACGPMDMMECISGIVDKHDVRCEVSVETTMACGIGACLGCVIEIPEDKERYHHVCIDGPVFDIRRIKF